MKLNFFKGRKENRQSYTQAILDAFHAGAANPAASSSISAMEACSGIVARAFAAAEVAGPDWARSALDPSILALVGRALMRRGDLALLIDTTGGRLKLLPAESHTVQGGYDPSTWRYRMTVTGPSTTGAYYDVSAARVVHVRYSVDSTRPWIGIGPIQAASLAGRLSAAVTKSLADEAGRTTGAFLSLPVDGEDSTLTNMKASIARAEGKLQLVEGGEWDTGRERADYTQKRFGPDAPQAVVNLMQTASAEVFAACGISAVLFAQTGEGTARREAYRQFLFSVVAPLGRILAAELKAKVDPSISLDWTELRAADIAGRARAFQSMVGGGMDIAQAAALSGLMVPNSAET